MARFTPQKETPGNFFSDEISELAEVFNCRPSDSQ
jgi:hypothetical protein